MIDDKSVELMNKVDYHLNKATTLVIVKHLLDCDDDFTPPLSARVKIRDYASQIRCKAIRFEAWSNEQLVGLVAVYCNDQKNCIAFITMVCITKTRVGEGIATSLLLQSIKYATACGMKKISLAVDCNNFTAIKLYEKIGFVMTDQNAQEIKMDFYLNCDKHTDQWSSV